MAGINRIALFTNEYPPHVYGGAGVHVEYLGRELSRLVPVEVRCFGEQDVRGQTCGSKGSCKGRPLSGLRGGSWR
jgi:hypothetical protein